MKLNQSFGLNMSKKINEKNIADIIPDAVRSNIPINIPKNPISLALSNAP